MPRRLSGHAKKRFFTRACQLPLCDQEHIIEQILHQAILTDINDSKVQHHCTFIFDGWTAIGIPLKKNMIILTIYQDINVPQK
ncbi:MAG: hypothetical protein Q8P20_06110 [bacterium]|nr:hypothetical protein [bacterium]